MANKHSWNQCAMQLLWQFGFFSIRMRIVKRLRLDCPICFVTTNSIKCPACRIPNTSGIPSTRINLSPFTKDFRGGEQLNESINQFFVALPYGGAPKSMKICSLQQCPILLFIAGLPRSQTLLVGFTLSAAKCKRWHISFHLKTCTVKKRKEDI